MKLKEQFHFLHRAYRYRFWTEKTQLQNLLNLNLKSTTAIDIGANRGIYTYWLAKMVTPGGKVLAFEPQPELCEEIIKICDWRGLQHVKVFNQGVSNKDGTLSLFRDGNGDGSATFEEYRKNNQQTEKLNISVNTLDSFVMNQNLKNISFIKIDVEGHEEMVIKGAIDTLLKYKPYVQIEIFDAQSRSAQTLINFFTNLGYAGKVLLDGGGMPDVEFLDSTPSPKFGYKGHRDLFFYHKSP
tara:strand:- start:1367 stop:2089 length:723 start_codon:yes stop_codon:yes gene_type:complete